MKFILLKEVQKMSKQSKEDIRRATFGKFDSEEDTYENLEHSDEETPKVHQNKKPSLAQKFKDTFAKKQEEEAPELWTGQTSVLDIIAPSSVDNGSRDYIVVDGVYHSYLYVAGYGYRTRNEAAWLSPLVEAGENIGISFTFPGDGRRRPWACACTGDCPAAWRHRYS